LEGAFFSVLKAFYFTDVTTSCVYVLGSDDVDDESYCVMTQATDTPLTVFDVAAATYCRSFPFSGKKASRAKRKFHKLLPKIIAQSTGFMGSLRFVSYLLFIALFTSIFCSFGSFFNKT